MREWCLLTPGGNIINMALTERPSGPVMGNMEHSKGYRWVPVESVGHGALEEYQFYNERP